MPRRLRLVAPASWSINGVSDMRATESLVHLAISHASHPVALAEIKAVTCKLMEGVKPTDEEMSKLALAYQRDPIMCTLDFQELQDFINDKFGAQQWSSN